MDNTKPHMWHSAIRFESEWLYPDELDLHIEYSPKHSDVNIDIWKALDLSKVGDTITLEIWGQMGMYHERLLGKYNCHLTAVGAKLEAI